MSGDNPGDDYYRNLTDPTRRSGAATLDRDHENSVLNDLERDFSDYSGQDYSDPSRNANVNSLGRTNMANNRKPGGLAGMENSAANANMPTNSLGKPNKSNSSGRDLPNVQRSNSFKNSGFDGSLGGAETTRIRRGQVRGFRKKTAIWSILAITGAGGLFGGLFAISGPAHFLQAASTVEHFTKGVVHMQKTARAFKNMHDVGRLIGRGSTMSELVKGSRLGILGNIQAKGVEKRLAKKGIKFKTGTFGSFSGIEVDMKNVGARRTRDMLRDMDIDRSKWKLDGNKLKISENLSPRELRRMIYFMDDPGKNKIVSYIGARRTMKRIGYVSWLHPIKKLENKALEKFEDFLSKKIDRITNKFETVDHADSQKRKEGGKGPRENTERAIDKGIQETASSSHYDKTIGRKIAKKVVGAFIKGSIATSVLGIYCAIKDIRDNFGPYKQANVVNVAQKASATLSGLSSQVKAGRDMDLPTLKQYSKWMLHDKIAVTDENGKKIGEKENAWEDAQSVCATLDTVGCDRNVKEQVDARLPSHLRNVKDLNIFGVPAIDGAFNWLFGNFFASNTANFLCPIIDKLDIVGAVLGWALQYAGESIMNALNLITFGMAEKGLKLMVDLLYGKVLNLSELTPAELGNTTMYGGTYISNEQANNTGGGRALSNAEALATRLDYREYLAWEHRQKPLLARLFDPTDYSSSISVLARNAKINTYDHDFSTQLANAFRLLTATPSLIASSANSLAGNSAYAASSWDYNVPTYAYSNGEVEEIATKHETFSNAESVLRQLAKEDPIPEEEWSMKKTPYKFQAKYCKAIKFDKVSEGAAVRPMDNTDGTAWNYRDSSPGSDSGTELANKVREANCGSMPMNLRLYIEDYFSIASSSCYYDDSGANGACEEMGADGGGDGGGNYDTSGNAPATELQRDFITNTHGTYGSYTVGYNGCTTITAWFIGAKTNLAYGHGHGGETAVKLLSANPNANLQMTSTPTKAPALFSTCSPRLIGTNCGNGPCPGGDCGHTGIVTKVNADGSIETLESGASLDSNPNKSFTRTISPSQYGNLTKFVYLGDHLK